MGTLPALLGAHLKLLLIVGATILLVVHMQPPSRLADSARNRSLSGESLRLLKVHLIADAAGALLVLLVNNVLSVYQPWGATGYGLARHGGKNEAPVPSGQTERRSWGFYVVVGLAALFALFVIVHLAGGGLGNRFCGSSDRPSSRSFIFSTNQKELF